MSTQAHIPPALCMIHNVIRIHDLTEIEEFDDEDIDDCDPNQSRSNLAEGPADREERQRATEYRDNIMATIWKDYRRICHAHQNT